jgi:serine protease inhibitor
MKKIINICILLCLVGCSKKKEFPKIVELDTLKHTKFSFTDTQKIEENKNQIYCPTLLFAWNYLKEKTNTRLEKGNELAQIFDKTESHINSLKENEYFNDISVENDLIKVKSEFSKSLPFAEEFTRNNIELKFSDNQKVESFGCYNCRRKTKQQIRVVHFGNQKDFAVRIIPKDKLNEIFLYCPEKPSNSLSENYADLRKKMSKKRTEKDWWRYSFLDEDIFEAPIIEFNIESNIKELKGVQLRSKNESIEIEEVRQRIALIFDEKGAEIESEAEISATATDAELDKPIPKKLIFDKPFLLVFKKKESENPYLMAWINNSELMKKENY